MDTCSITTPSAHLVHMIVALSGSIVDLHPPLTIVQCLSAALALWNCTILAYLDFYFLMGGISLCITLEFIASTLYKRNVVSDVAKSKWLVGITPNSGTVMGISASHYT